MGGDCLTDTELIADLRQVLEGNMYQLVEYGGFSGFFCVCCDALREAKHKPDCEIARVLNVRST